MLETHGSWTYEANCIETARAEVAQIVGHVMAEAPAGNRSHGLIAYLKAAERSLEGARLFAEGKDLACQEADEAQDHLCDKTLEKSPASEDASGLLNEVFSSVGETEIEEDSAGQRKLTVEEYRLAHAVTSLVCLQYPEAAQGLQSVKPTGVSTGHGRRCIKVAIRDRSGVVIDSSWWTEPGMDAAKVAEALAQMIRAELDPSVPFPKVEQRPFKVRPLHDDGTPFSQDEEARWNEESDSFFKRVRAESSERLRRIYDAHPATDIPPIPWPEDQAWEEGKAGVRICGELWFESHLDECRTWSAVLTRMAHVATERSEATGTDAEISALFLSRIIGAHTEEKAKDAVVEAARRAGWLSRQ